MVGDLLANVQTRARPALMLACKCLQRVGRKFNILVLRHSVLASATVPRILRRSESLSRHGAMHILGHLVLEPPNRAPAAGPRTFLGVGLMSRRCSRGVVWNAGCSFVVWGLR